MPRAKPNQKRTKETSPVYELIEQGLEDECIALLKTYESSKVEALQKNKSIWHMAVRNNLAVLIDFLATAYPNNIDCLDDNNATPWVLAVIENKVEIAKKLQSKGANAGIFVNEQGQTLLHKAVADSDIGLLKQCVNCDVPANLKDAKGFSAQFYAHAHKKGDLTEILKKLNYSNDNDGDDLCNSVIRNDSQSLQILLDTGFDIQKINHPTLLDRALIYKSKEVEVILRAAGDRQSKTDNEIQEIRRQKFGKKPNPLVTTYAMEKLSLKKSVFKITPLYLLAVSLFSALFTSMMASTALAIGAGVVSGLIYVACLGALHVRKIKEEKTLKASYKKALDQKRVEALKLAEQIHCDKNTKLLEKLANEFTDAAEPSFTTTEQGERKITTGKLLLIDKQIAELKKAEVEMPEIARLSNRSQI